MPVSAAALTEALAGVVGSERLLTDPATLARYAVDGLPPRWVAFPVCQEELTRLMRLAAEDDLAVVPRGSGRRLGLGNIPARVDLVVELSRFSKLVEYQPHGDARSRMTLQALAARLTPRRQWLPVDPLVGTSRTIGGVMAVNRCGTAPAPLRHRA